MIMQMKLMIVSLLLLIVYAIVATSADAVTTLGAPNAPYVLYRNSCW